MGFLRWLGHLGVSPGDTPTVIEAKVQYTIIYVLSFLFVGAATTTMVTNVTMTSAVGLVGMLCIFAIGLSYLWITKRPPLVEFTTLSVALCILIMDIGAVAVIDVSRTLSGVVVVMDARLLMNANPTISSVLVVGIVIYLVATEVERVLETGLLNKIIPTEERLKYVDCSTPPCPRPVGLALREVVSFGVVFVIDFLATRYFAVNSRAERMRMEAAVETAEKVAQALANFDLDSAGEANQSELLPEGLVNAFRTLVSNLAMYKPYLPDSCLPEMMREEDAVRCPSTPSVDSNKPSLDEVDDSVASTIDQSSAVGMDQAALHSKRSHVTLMVFNIRGFLSMEWDPAQASHTALVSAVGSAVHATHGLIDGFIGDRVGASFNGAKACAQHAVSAARCSLHFLRSWGEDPGAPQVSIGIATGSAYCGVLGNEYLRRYGVVGKVGCWVTVVERWATQRGIPVLCTGTTYRDASYYVQGRLEVDRLVVRKMHLEEKRLALWRLYKERTADTDVEWMYQIEGARKADSWKVYNDVVRLLHQGSVDRAVEMLDGNDTAEVCQLRRVLTNFVEHGVLPSCEIQVTEVGIDPSSTSAIFPYDRHSTTSPHASLNTGPPSHAEGDHSGLPTPCMAQSRVREVLLP